MLGSADVTLLNYLYKYKLNYNVINPVNSIISIIIIRSNRDHVTINGIRNHSDGNYNTDISFNLKIIIIIICSKP